MTGPDRRIMAWLTATVTTLVLLFSYHTSLAGPGGRRTAALAPVGVVAASTPTGPPAGQVPAAAPPRPRVKTPSGRSSSAPAATARSAAPATATVPNPPASAVQPAAPRRTAAPRVTSASKPTPAQPTTRTINGAPADTRYGPVQVQIRMSGQRIVSADAIVYPTNSSRDQEINSQAIPQLNDETMKAQSANIDTVSGATYTSDGYRQSLQSALDAAHR
jgi:uncharacterized protein with FMN-binding domain